MRPTHDRGRPVTIQTPSQMSIATDKSMVATDASTVVHCARCGHVLTAERSVELELGPVCRRVFASEVAA